jgi:hypothetical protein
MAYWRPSFGPSDKSHMYVYDMQMTCVVSLTSLHVYSRDASVIVADIFQYQVSDMRILDPPSSPAGSGT